MKATNGWPLKPTSIGSLFLDPHNPRLAPAVEKRTERQIIEEIVLHEDVLELSKQIKTHGFFPSEPLIAVLEGGKKIVVEGNRRLAACKLLLNPSLAPKSHEKRMRTIAGNFNAQALGKLPVLLAPSREAAYPLIIARHTDTQIVKWEPAMQAHFYSNLISAGLTVEEVAERFGVKTADIKEALHSHNLYRMACRLDVPTDVAEIVQDPRQFNLTTLKRVFDTPAGRAFFGVEMGPDGVIRGTVEADEFKKGFNRLVTDIAKKKQDSRTLNSPKEIEKYLNGFKASEKPDKSVKGKFDSGSFETDQTPKGPAPTTKPKKPRTSSNGASVGLIPLSFPCRVQNDRVKNLVKELKGLSPSRFANSCALAFRCLLEISAYCFLEGKGEVQAMHAEYLAEIQKKNASRNPERHIKPEPDWTPNLNAMMNRLGEAQRGLLKNNHTVKALNKVIKEEEELFGLNLSTHNTTYHPTDARLRATWQNLQEYFREILA